MPLSDLTHDEISRIYGPWTPRTPADVADLFADYPGRWWIAGGWALEAFTGISRPHGDVDPSIPRADLAQLRRHLAGRIDLWSADQETLRLLLPGDIDDDTLADTCENVWARDGGGNPWQYDIILMGTRADRWIFKKDSRISRPLDEIIWSFDGVPYLRPEVQLLHKAGGRRPKDDADFHTTWPRLDPATRSWLRDALDLAHPAHPWIAFL